MRIPGVDRFLDGITMYRLMLYGLSLITLCSVIFGFLELVSFSGVSLFASVIVLLFAAYGSNWLLARMYGVVTNAESSAITALILFFIFTPATTIQGFGVLILAAFVAMASKYVLNYRGRHLFNPAAVAAVALGFSATTAASWWVATPALLPYMLLFGFLVVRKIERFTLVGSFFVTALLGITFMGVRNGVTVIDSFEMALLSWPIVFFSTIMLTEPITTPPRQALQGVYGVLVGVLFTSQFHLGPLFATPEIALVLGNVFSYLVSSKERLTLRLHEKNRLANDIYEFVFRSERKPKFLPGQYMEWTLAHDNIDTRGNRRYFTVASSPTESEIRLGVRLVDKGSSFKHALSAMEIGDVLYAGQCAGDFTLPKNVAEKLVFVAGGIGVTPFRSMLAYLRDTQQKRDVIVLYCVRTYSDLAYVAFFDEIKSELGITMIPVVADATTLPERFTGVVGMLDAALIKRLVPDYLDRTFYISGPPMMVQGVSGVLRKLGSRSSRIKTDFFPGFGG